MTTSKNLLRDIFYSIKNECNLYDKVNACQNELLYV